MSESLYIGIDLGGTNMQIGVVNAAGDVLSRSKKKTRADEGHEAVLARLVEGVDESCAEAGVTRGDIVAIGLGAPGAVNPHTGVCIEAVNLRWNDLPVTELLGSMLGVPVFLDNDVNVAVYGEWHHGAGNKAQHLLGVWVGTGIGGGLILNGALHYGHFLTAGEIGHMLIDPAAAPGNRSLEQNCSRAMVVDRIMRVARANRPTILNEWSGGKASKVKSRMLADAYKQGDTLTVEIIDDAAVRIGQQIGSVSTLLSLERVILGGGLTEAMGQPFVDRVAEHARKTVFPQECAAFDVVASVLEDNAGVIGAAMIAADRMDADPTIERPMVTMPVDAQPGRAAPDPESRGAGGPSLDAEGLS